MKIKVLAVGKTDDKNLQVLIDKYQKRLRHYVKFEFEVVPDLKKTKNLSLKQNHRTGLWQTYLYPLLEN